MTFLNEIEIENLTATSENELDSIIDGLKTVIQQLKTENESLRKKIYYTIGVFIEKNKEILSKRGNIYKKLAAETGKSVSTIYRCHQYYLKFPTEDEFNKSLSYTWRQICKMITNSDQRMPETVVFISTFDTLQRTFNYLHNNRYFLTGFVFTGSKYVVVGSKEHKTFNLPALIAEDDVNKVVEHIKNLGDVEVYGTNDK
ncbi:MAG: hypothetical protein QXP36_00150 [Conexivisphaerales archaeon]